MKRSLFIGLFVMMSHWSYSQNLTLAELKAMKDQFQPEIIRVADANIAYPVTGMVNINIASSLKGETVIEIEVWIVDSKGKLVYNNIFAARDLTEKDFDKDYMHIMKMQGRHLLKRRHLFAGSNNHKTGDS